MRRRPEKRDALDRVWRGDVAVQWRISGAAVPDRTNATVAAVEPATNDQCGAGPGVEYGRFVYDEYELAGLLGRINHELLHADGRARISQLCFSGGGYGAGDGSDSGSRAPGSEDHRQFLGGHDARAAVDPIAREPDRCVVFRIAGRDSESAAVHGGECYRASGCGDEKCGRLGEAGYRLNAGDRPRTCGFPGSYQDVGD